MNLRGSRWKKMVYRYDLISGKVNHVAYQPKMRDAIYHRYGYDAENRLILAEVSTDSLYWDRDGRYDYYRHGPLARTLIGHQSVQGLDYAYTLQGWLKGLNGTVMNPQYDMGGDGLPPPQGGAGGGVARDTFGFSLYYHGNDYSAINDANRFAGLRDKLVTAAVHRPLFNGNISAMAVNIGVLNKPVVYNYSYDQLNRIVAMGVFNGTNTGVNLWSGTFTATNSYKEGISYDANGNILKYFRKADSTGTSSSLNGNMDSLTYNYISGTNKLSFVRDRISNSTTHGSNQSTDIDDQFTSNYLYDEIGNLVRDSAESIRLSVGGIKWNVYGKITEINKITTGNKSVKKISYTYDAAGNRIGKKVEKYNSGSTDYTWYVRDASGNTMSVYNFTDSLIVSEQHIYGSSRLGMLTPGINLERAVPSATSMPILSGSGNFGTFIRGNKFFELSNHLGNVLVTLSDKKKGIQNGSTGTVLYYLPIVKSAQDYYPFGMAMPGRKYTAGSLYRYGFNGKENDNDVKGDGNQQDYGMRIYDTRLGRFLSTDPITSNYPELTPYQFASNSPIAGIDLDGLEFEQLREEIQRERQVLKNIQNKQVKRIVQTRTSNCHTISPVPSNNKGNANGPNIFKRGFDMWLPQMMIYGNGSESIGSKPTDSRPIITVHLGEGGETNELFESIMLFTDMYKNTKAPENPAEEIIESSPELLKKTLDEIKKRMEENKKEKINDSEVTPNSQTETKNVNEQKQKAKDTIYRMYSRPSGGATSVLYEATSEWKKFRKENPKSKKEMKTYDLKGKVLQNE